MKKMVGRRALSLACCLYGLGQTPESNPIESKILALENSWSQAEEHQDFKALDGLLDSRLIYVNYDGAVWNKAQYVASLKDPASHEEQGVNETMTARVFGDSAVVIGIYRIKGTKNGKPFLRRERYLDMWVQQNGQWMCVASEVTLINH